MLQNEYSTWIVKDKHSKAYASLQGDIGERMATILGIGKAETRAEVPGVSCARTSQPRSARARLTSAKA